MKKIIQFSIYIVAVVFLLNSCEQDPIDPLTGKYPVPEEFAFTQLFHKASQKLEGGSRIFTLKMATDGITTTYNESTFSHTFSGSGNYLSVDLVGTDYFLEEGTYAVADNSSAVSGNYIAGYDATFGEITYENWGTCLFSVAGGTPTGLKVKSGNLYVTKAANNYSISGTLTLADESVVRVAFEGEIIYEEDPYIPTYTYSVEEETPAMGGSDGTVAIAGATKHKISVFADGELSTYLEIVTDASANSLSGTYTVKDGIDAAGQLSNGYYLDFAWWGGEGVMEGGSYYLENGEKMFIREGAGVVTIVDNAGTLAISANNLAILDVATVISSSGATWQNLSTPGSINIENATKLGGATEDIDLQTLISASALDLANYGGTGYSINLKLATDGVTATYDAATYSYVYAGTGNYISLDFSRDDATLPAGTYNVVSNEAATVGDCIAGYPNPYGEGTWGSVWGSITEGAASDLAVTGGTVVIAIDGDTYTITIDITTNEGSVNASYTGIISIQ